MAFDGHKQARVHHKNSSQSITSSFNGIFMKFCCGLFRYIQPSRCLVIASGVIVTKYEGSFLWDRFANVIFSVATNSMISVSTIDFCNTVMQENG